MTCRHCGATVPENAERCPKRLRRSGFLGAEAETPPALPAENDPQKAPQKGNQTRPVQATLVLVGVVVLLVGVRAVLREAFLPAPSMPFTTALSLNLDPHDL